MAGMEIHQMNTESRILADIRLALGADPRCVLWRNSTGVAESEGRKMRFGLVRGGADLIGIVAPRGRFFALEVKAERGRVSTEQTQFIELVRRMGGFAAVVRSVDEAKAALDAAVAGR